MNRPLLLRLNRLLRTANVAGRDVFLHAALKQRFGLAGVLPQGVPVQISAQVLALLASCPAAPEGTPGALTPEIFALLHETGAARRKTQGIFYTPRPVAQLLAQEVLHAVLTGPAGIPDKTARALIYDTHFTLSDDKTAGFLDRLTVCDPAAGAGGLLLPFALLLAQVRRKLEPQKTTAQLLSEIFARNLYGADLDCAALEILQLRAYLLLRHYAPDTPPCNPVVHVRCTDALQTQGGVPSLGKQWQISGFDAVLANPPFVGQKNHSQVFRTLKQNAFWKTKITPKSDLLYLFFYLSLDILKPGGCAGFITTPYFTTSAGAEPLRAALQQQVTFRRLIDFGQEYLFAQAGQHTLLSVFEKSTLKKPCLAGKEPVKIAQAELFSGPDKYILTCPPAVGYEQELLANMAACTRRLGSVAHISNGLMSGCDKITGAHLKKFPHLAARPGEGVFVLGADEAAQMNLLPAEKDRLKPFFKNSDIYAFAANENPRYYLIDIFYPKDRAIDWTKYPRLRQHLARFKPVLLARRQNNNGIDKALARGEYAFGAVRRKMNFDGEKLVVPHRSPTNTFAYTAGPWYASSDVYFISNPSGGVTLWYLLALFNSAPYKTWLAHYGKRKGTLLELYAAPLRELPVPAVSAREQHGLETLAQTIYRRKKQHLPTEKWGKKLNLRVARLFGVSPADNAAPRG